MKHKKFLVLPADMQNYYKISNLNYKKIPEFYKNCVNGTKRNFTILTPKNKEVIFIPNENNPVVFEAFADENEILYWTLDKKFLRRSDNFHKIKIKLKKGEHNLTVISARGEKKAVKFWVK